MFNRSLANMYADGRGERDQFLRRAYICSRLTIPSLIPERETSAEEMAQKFNSIGSEAVNSLANKMLLALFPPGQTFFRLRAVAEAERQINEAQQKADANDDDDARQQITEARNKLEVAFGEAEIALLREFEAASPRPELFQALRHMIVGGSAAIWYHEDELLCVPLSNLVLQRAGRHWKRVIVRSFIPLEDLKPEFIERARKGDFMDMVGDEGADSKRDNPDPQVREVALYTVQEYVGNKKYKVWQELGDGTLYSAGTFTFDEDSRPILPQTYNLLPRENYGRGLVEDYIGDFAAIEGLSKSSVDLAAVMSRVIGLMAPGAVTSAEDVNACPNGGIISGRPEDLKFVQVEKTGDLAGAKAVADEIVLRIRTAFLSAFAARRQGERVTAEEIRLIAQQLEETLGGVYSTLTTSLQLPLVKTFISRLKRKPQYKTLFAVSEPVVVAGLEALGRQADISRLATYAQVMTPLIGPEQFMRMHRPQAIARRVASSIGLNVQDLIKTDSQMAQEAAAAQQQQMQSEAVVGAVKGAAGPVAKAMTEGSTTNE